MFATYCEDELQSKIDLETKRIETELTDLHEQAKTEFQAIMERLKPEINDSLLAAFQEQPFHSLPQFKDPLASHCDMTRTIIETNESSYKAYFSEFIQFVSNRRALFSTYEQRYILGECSCPCSSFELGQFQLEQLFEKMKVLGAQRDILCVVERGW